MASTGFHNPAMLAAKANAVDEISGGRLILGLGAGWNEAEYRAFGLPFDQRVSRFEEAFTIIRRLLGEGHVDFSGRFHEARDLPLLPPPARPGGPPLMVGSIGPRMLSITLPHVAAWNAWGPWFGNSVAGLRPGSRAGRRGLPGGRSRPRGRRADRRAGRGAARRARPWLRGDRRAVRSRCRAKPDALAGALTAFAQLGVAHVQLVLDPITVGSIEALAPALAALDG